MNAILQEQFNRVETALITLIDSISSYTPSPNAAISLVEADDQLLQRLEQLSAHQANHNTITRLRQITSDLSDQTTQILTRLASTRADILSTPVTTFANEGVQVPYEELLAYAKRISKFTVPPSHLRRDDTRGKSAAAEEDARPPNAENDLGTDAEANGAAGRAAAGDKEGERGAAVTALPAEETQWLDPDASFEFTPWPGEEVIRRGALGRIQAMLETGQDPLSAGRPEQEMTEQKEEGVQEDQMQVDVPEPVEGRQARRVATHTVQEEKPAVFGGLDLYDPDEE